jgi:hypothetical protein
MDAERAEDVGEAQEMASRYGEKHGLPGYDKFRTGLTYRAVWEMFRDDDDDRAKWRYKRRGTILGHWHELKLQMYHQAQDELETQRRGRSGACEDARCGVKSALGRSESTVRTEVGDLEGVPF